MGLRMGRTSQPRLGPACERETLVCAQDRFSHEPTSDDDLDNDGNVLTDFLKHIKRIRISVDLYRTLISINSLILYCH